MYVDVSYALGKVKLIFISLEINEDNAIFAIRIETSIPGPIAQ